MKDSAFVEHCAELLAGAGAVRVRRMFGGHGLYVDELFVAIVAGERLYLKTDADSRPAFEAAGSEAFVYDAKAGAVAMSYWSAPPEAMESPALMLPWARVAIAAALRARAAKAGKAARPLRPGKAARPAAATAVATRRARPATAKRR